MVRIGSIWSRWPVWSGYVAAGWSLVYAVLGIYWTAGGAGFPFAPIDDDHATASVLEGTRAAVGGPVMAVVGVLGVVAGLAMARGIGAGRRPMVLVVFGWVVAASLTLLIPDYTLLGVLAFAPALLVFTFTGVPGPQNGVGDVLYWHRVNLIILFLGGLVWAAATLACQRRRRAACEHCGRRHGAVDDGPSRETLLRWGRWAVVVACAAPLPYEITRVSWFLGFPLGISEDFLRMMQDTPGMLFAGLACAVGSSVGGVLTQGLVRRWGEVYPRWVWFRAGRRVPPALAIVPASIVAMVLVPAGLMALWTPQLRGSWALYVPSLFWVVWSAGLGAATVAYWLRRRRPCRWRGAGAPAVSVEVGSSR